MGGAQRGIGHRCERKKRHPTATHGGVTAPTHDMHGIVFFFQAEDGIRDVAVTGVQTCALPIFDLGPGAGELGGKLLFAGSYAAMLEEHKSLTGRYLSGELRIPVPNVRHKPAGKFRSEERRVGKECRSRWSPYHLKKKKYWR